MAPRTLSREMGLDAFLGAEASVIDCYSFVFCMVAAN